MFSAAVAEVCWECPCFCLCLVAQVRVFRGVGVTILYKAGCIGDMPHLENLLALEGLSTIVLLSVNIQQLM